jgi:hypothetical protein
LADDLQKEIEGVFHERLLAAALEVRQQTRIGLDWILEQLETLGGVRTAKMRLRGAGDSFFDKVSLVRLDEYFFATKRIGRMDLSVEAIVLEPRWSPIFTRDELDRAALRLSEGGFNPPLERPLAPTDCTIASDNSRFTQLSLGAPWYQPRTASQGRTLRAALLRVTKQRSDCEIAAEQAVALRERQHPIACSAVREHLDQCLDCQRDHSDLVSAYGHFDAEVLGAWTELLRLFQKSMKLGDADLKRLMLLQPEDYEEPGEYECDLDRYLRECIRPLCSWRAVRLGCHIGRLMSAFACTFAGPGNLWLTWRSGEMPARVSGFVRSVDRSLFILGITACNLLLARKWPKADEPILWLPTDGDLNSVPGVVRAEYAHTSEDLADWEEVLGSPPEDVDPLALLYLADQAAIAQVQEAENSGTDLTVGTELIEYLRRNFGEVRDALNAMQAKQDAEITFLERMVAYMSSSDIYTCEQVLLNELPGVYARLEPQARCLLLAAEQMHQRKDIAAPALIVQAIAAAFETQLRGGVLSPLLAYLKSQKTHTLWPLEDWVGVEHKRPIYRSNFTAERFPLGGTEWLLRHPAPEIADGVGLLGLDRSDLQEAVAAVRAYRNPAAHGESIDPEMAKEIRSDWLRWRAKPGGIFAVLFRSE